MKEARVNGQVIQGCLKALEIYPDDIRLRRLLAESYHEAGFIGQAESELARVTPEIDDLASAYKLQARIYARQKRLRIFRVTETDLALNPNDREGHDLLEKIRPAEAAEPPEEEPQAEPVEAEPEMEPVTEMGAARPEGEQAAEALQVEPEPPGEEPPPTIIEWQRQPVNSITIRGRSWRPSPLMKRSS